MALYLKLDLGKYVFCGEGGGVLFYWVFVLFVESLIEFCIYVYFHQTSNISDIVVGNEIVDHADVVRSSPVGAAPTTSSFSSEHLASMDWAKTTARRDEKHLGFMIWWDLY